MTDVTARIRRAGGMNYAFRASACMWRWKFIYLSEDPKRKVISRPVSLRDARRYAGAGNIGQGIMIFAERDTKSKMYADISDGYSYPDIRHGRMK